MRVLLFGKPGAVHTLGIAVLFLSELVGRNDFPDMVRCPICAISQLVLPLALGYHRIEGGLLGRVQLAKDVPIIGQGIAVENLELGILKPPRDPQDFCALQFACGKERISAMS